MNKHKVACDLYYEEAKYHRDIRAGEIKWNITQKKEFKLSLERQVCFLYKNGKVARGDPG